MGFKMYVFQSLRVPDNIRYLQIPSNVDFLVSGGRDYGLPSYFETYTHRNESVLVENMKIPISELSKIPKPPYELRIGNVIYREKEYYTFERKGESWYFVDKLESSKDLYYLVTKVVPDYFDLRFTSIFIDKNVLSYTYTMSVLYMIVDIPARLRLWTMVGKGYPPAPPSEIRKATIYIDGTSDKSIKVKTQCKCLSEDCNPRYCHE